MNLAYAAAPELSQHLVDEQANQVNADCAHRASAAIAAIRSVPRAFKTAAFYTQLLAAISADMDGACMTASEKELAQNTLNDLHDDLEYGVAR